MKIYDTISPIIKDDVESLLMEAPNFSEYDEYQKK
jgi:hypothetical protein